MLQVGCDVAGVDPVSGAAVVMSEAWVLDMATAKKSLADFPDMPADIRTAIEAA